MIVLRELTKRFGHVLAVDRASFEVAEGEVFGLIGSNGAGKSTIIKMLTTLLPASSGEAMIAGCDIRQEPAAVRRHVGYVPQLLSADGMLTGYENMLLSARLYAVPRRERKARIDESLAALNLTQVAGRLAHHYSGGMVRSLEIAQNLLHRPKVLFMDEPTVGLDPVARHGVWEHVRALQRSAGMTILITTHYMQEADELCGRIAIIDRGCIAAIGTPAELKAVVGPTATLDDAFAHFTGGEPEGGGYASSRVERLSAGQHG
ncbi:MAG TPA: ATP-binding cassette domain-containing protein [Stellaceae bacterium]|nr:ATP-binding cassette domain-containing protein [Stellaceae bacterium]